MSRLTLVALEDRAVPAINWLPLGGGAWNNPANWLDPVSGQNRLPTASDAVSLPDGDFTVSGNQACQSLSVATQSTFTVTGNLTVIASATLGGSMTLDSSVVGGGMTVGTSFSVADPLTLARGRLFLSETDIHVIGDRFTFTGGTFQGGSPTNLIALNNPVFVTGPGDKTLLSAYLRNSSVITHDGPGNLLAINGHLVNEGTFDLHGDGDWLANSVNTGAVFFNEGLIVKSAGTGVSGFNGLVNRGGDIEVAVGQLDLLLQNGVSTGLDIDVGTTATVNFNTAMSLNGRLAGSNVFTGTGRVYLNGQLQIGPGGASIDAPPGLLEWTEGMLIATEGPLTNRGTLTISGTSRTVTGTVVNDGTIRHGGTGTLGVAANFTNNGLYEFTADTSLGASSGSSFVNVGTLRKAAGTGASSVSGFLVNRGGRVEVTSGVLAYGGFFAVVDGGHFDVSAGALLDYQGSLLTGRLSGSGAGTVLLRHVVNAGAGGATLDMPGALLQIDGATLNGGTAGLTLAAGGTVNVGANRTLNLAGLVRNDGTLDQQAAGTRVTSSGTIENHGTHLIGPGGTVSVSGQPVQYINGSAGAPGVLRKVGGLPLASINMAFANPAGGTIAVDEGRLNIGPFTNTGGTITVAAPATFHPTNGYAQTSGTILVNGTLDSPAVDVTGGTLTGAGTVTGSAGLSNASVVAPAGPLSVSSVFGGYVQTAAGALQLDLNGPTACDRLAVTGRTTLNGGLTGSVGFATAPGDVFRVIDNDGTDAVTGTFAGLPEGAEVIFGGTRLRVSYVGGTGNDVTLTTVGFTTSPPTADAGGPYTITEGDPLTLDASGSMDPDGDPLTYSWDVNGDGVFGDATGVGPTLAWADLEALGITDGPAVRTVRVRVADSTHPAVESAPALLTVMNEAPAAAVAGPTTAVRAQARTFTVSATDVAADRAAGFTYQIDWGEGNPPETITPTPGNGAGVTSDHTFTEAGTYAVRVTATDKDGRVSPAATLTVTVARVALQDDPLVPGQQMLVVGGTPGADTVRVSAGPTAGDVVVRMNARNEGTFRPTSRAVVYGSDGADVVTVLGQVTHPAWLFGGDGNDRLIGGNGPNVVVGGAGNDSVRGRDGRDLLVGGTGRDTVRGSRGDDLLVAGVTAFDAAEPALAAVQAEWLSARSYASRLANLRNDSTNAEFGARANGDTFLVATTVADDGDRDRLVGNTGLDAFFADTDAGTLDTVARPDAGEVTVDVD